MKYITKEDSFLRSKCMTLLIKSGLKINIKYKIDYHPSLESLKMLHSRMISLCDECGIILTNVVEEHYQLVYYMKASGNYAAITFFFNGKGFINYAAPLSDIGEADIKLSQLIEKLT